MPIQINELTIKVEVTDTVQQVSLTSTSNNNNNADGDLRKLIRECVDEVMEVLRNQKER